MNNIKLACDAASAVACALLEYSRKELDSERFSKYVSEHFPKEVAVILIPFESLFGSCGVFIFIENNTTPSPFSGQT